MSRQKVLSKVAGVAIAIILVLVSGAVLAARDYQGLADRIADYLNEAVTLYRDGSVDEAKTRVQKAYFEVFENLEGPIRVNVSAKRSFELESEFGAIRKLIVQGKPVEEVEARVKAQVAAIQAIVPKLEEGFHLKAEASHQETTEPAPPEEPASKRIEPHWVAIIDGIEANISAAADAHEKGDADVARALIQKARFEGYKNSLLETAVRRYVSQRQDAEFNGEFTRILGLVRDGRPARMIRASGKVLAEEMKESLPGLPLMGAAKQEAVAEETGAATDWRAVADEVIAGMRANIALYEKGEVEKAVSAIQDLYFDVFEASGMENQLGARDSAFKTTVEGHFSRMAARMQAGAPASDLSGDLSAMAADLDKAVGILGEGGQSPWTLFLYALMIILREGFEAILIVTAILAYLAKTDNRDKFRVIYNSVGVALVASIATAILVKWVFDISAASQEVLEGATMLVAAVVLFWMSYWLVSKAESQKWMRYIKDRLGSSLTSGSVAALWFTSFLAVYREGAETVLFYQALTVGGNMASNTVVLAGFLIGCLLLGVLYAVMRLGAMKLPIRPFFMVTGLLLYYMAFVFAGKGVMELVEGKILEPTMVAWVPEIPFLGVFPYWQTLAPQLALVLAAILAAVILLRQRPPASVPSRVEKS